MRLPGLLSGNKSKCDGFVGDCLLCTNELYRSKTLDVNYTKKSVTCRIGGGNAPSRQPQQCSGKVNTLIAGVVDAYLQPNVFGLDEMPHEHFQRLPVQRLFACHLFFHLDLYNSYHLLVFIEQIKYNKMSCRRKDSSESTGRMRGVCNNGITFSSFYRRI